MRRIRPIAPNRSIRNPQRDRYDVITGRRIRSDDDRPRLSLSEPRSNVRIDLDQWIGPVEHKRGS